MAINPNPDEEVHMMFNVNARAKFNPPLPSGYYGNVIAYATAVTTAGKLCSNPLGFALELVHKAKADVTEEYMRSVGDFMVVNGRPHFRVTRTYLVSDERRLGLREIDFGWEAVYGGAAKGCAGIVSFYRRFRSRQGEEVVAVRICLPPEAMDTFAEKLGNILNGKEEEVDGKQIRALSSL